MTLKTLTCFSLTDHLNHDRWLCRALWCWETVPDCLKELLLHLLFHELSKLLGLP